MGIALAILGAIAFPVILLFLVFGLPVIGNHVVLSMAVDHGCRVNAAGSHPCVMLGIDWGDTVYSYGISSLLGGIINPIILLRVINRFVPFWVMFYGTQLWVIATVAAVILRRDAMKRLGRLSMS